MEQAENQLRQAKRYGQSFSLLMFDIDYFKRINDSYGHDVGDKLLEMLGGAVQEILRETDIIGRMGGEEFLVAMPETDLNVASLVAERIRAELMKIKVRTSVGTIGFTVSIGLTQLSDTELTLSDLMKKVDLLLYEAKAAGKNNVMSR